VQILGSSFLIGTADYCNEASRGGAGELCDEMMSGEVAGPFLVADSVPRNESVAASPSAV
jgi:hypothetical protein